MASLAVKVAVKVRPLNKRENAQHEKECTIIEPASGNLKSIKLGPEGKAFTYDYVVSHTERADDFYKECVSYLVDGLFEGYNATVLAYGQTGSGKTYSMGTSGKMSETEEDNLGVVPRAAIQIFQMIDAIRQKYINKTAKPTITVKTKFLELYQDKLVDLYDCKNPNPPRITQDPKSGIQVNSKEREVRDAEEIIEVLQEGAQNRQVGGTNMNAESSRSHAVFIIDITQEIIDFESADGEEADKNRTELTAKFCLVDLAGSERLGKTGAEGGRKQEGIAINQGLLALGNVISALGNPRKKAHVNYRDTKLTLLLKDSLGGNSKTLMIACISPSAGEINETKNTLEYANRARSIKNTPKKNQDEASLQMAKLKEQIAELEAALQNCTCGNISAIPTRIKAESEEEQEAVVEKIVEDRPVVYQHRQSSTNSLLSSNPRCVDSPDGGSLRFAMSSCPIDNQTIMLEQKNEDLEAKIKSLQIVNTRISHNLSELKTRMALLKMSYKANSDKELNTMMTQQLQDYKLKNEELEMEMSCRKKYYSLLDEYRREREKRIEPFVNQNNERMAQDILNLAEEDICRRKEFYESLPALISRPRKKKRKRRAKYRLLPKQLSPCLFDLADFENASEEVLNTVDKAEKIYSSHRAADYAEGEESIIYDHELKVILEEREKTKQRLDQLTLGFNGKYRLEQKNLKQTMEMEDSSKESEPTLYSAEDYAHASGEVLAMMRRDETRFAKERAQQKLKEIEMSRKESEANANAHASEENKEPTLYSAEDYAHASGEVLAMMRRDETRFAKERAQQKLKEKETSRKESEASASLDNKEPTLYSAEDYAHASGEVLAMMRRDETRFAKERAQQKLKELEMSRKESEASASEENKEPTLYSAEDYAHASGEVLAMMRRDETRFAKERAQQKLKEKETSRKESEASASLDNKEPTLYSAEDYAHASGEVLAMMRRDETRFAKERAQQKLKEIEMSKKVSEANSDASAKKEEPTLYCAEDYAHASGEVLVMMRRDETRFAKERAQQKLKEIEMSRKESEANASVEREEKFVDGLPDTPDEISRNTVVPITRSKARVSLRDLKLSSTIAEQSNSEVIQESFRDSYSELEHEAVLTSSIKGVEEGVSHLDDCLPPQEDILNSTIREDPINLSKHIPEAINSSLFPAAKQHCDAEGDLISYLPEEDQAIQVALMDICTVTVPPLDPPVEIPNSEPSNPYFLKYLDFSSDSNSAFDSDENEHVNEANELNSNTEIWNPDVLILCEDINLRKKLSKQLKQERIDHSNLKKQNCQRVAELETKICRLQDSRDQLMKELNESNNITKALKNTKKNSDEKKVSNLSKDLTEEKKKVTSLNKDLNDEKKKSKQLEKELTQTRGNENWKIAFETSEKKRKELEANMKVSQKKADIKVKDQANKIKDFEKKAEIQMTIEKSKTKEVNKFIADNSKLNREYSESKKKIENLGQKNSRLQSLLTETMAKLTKNKSSTPATVAKKNATKTTDISGKLGEKNVPSRTPSMRECKDQESKDPAKYLELIETLVKNNLNKPAITQHIKAFVEKRVTSQLDKNRKLAVKKVAAVDLSRKERRFDKSFQKDDKSIDLKGLKFDAKKVAGNDLPEDINSFVSGLNEKRCKRTLEAMFLHSLHEGARKKAREIEEERLSTTNAELAEKVYRMEKIKTFFKDDLVVVDTRAKTNDPSTIHSYSTSDLSHIKLNRLPPQDAPVTIKVPSSENIRASSPNLSGSSRHNTSRSNLSARSCYHGGLSSNSNSNSTSNLRSSSPAKSISSLQNKPNTASSTGSLCPNKQACLNKSPAKHPPLVRTKTQVPLPNPRDPVKKAVSVSTPPSTQTRNFSIGQSADDAALLSPTTKPPLLLQSSFPPRSNSNKKTAPNTNQPACTSKRVTTPAVTPITIRHTNSPAVLHPTTKSSSAVSPTHCSNPGTPLSPIPARHTSIQIKPKQLQQTEAIQSTKIPPTKVVTHPQETQSATHQKHKQPSIKAPRKLDILKPNTTFSDEELKSILTLRMEEDSLFIASSEYTIRCIDLETMQEKYAQRPIRVTDIVRKLEYRVSDKLLYVSSGKKIEIFDLRSQQPVFEIKSFCGDKSIISDMVTTMDPNLLYLACGPDVLVWELTSNKLYGKLTGNTSAISKMCYGVRESKYPLLAICCKDQSVKIYDYPEAYWSKLAENPTDSTSSSSLNKIPSLKPARLSAKSFSLPENVYSPLFQGFLSKPPFAANKMAYLNNSSIVHYSDVLLLSNNVDILQYNIQEKRLQNQINHIQSSKNSNKNMSDISNMVRFPNQPLLVTTCRKGSVNFWDPITLKLFSKQNYYANTQFLYENQQVMSLSCNSRMIATTSNKNPHLVKLWNVDMDFLNSH